MRSLNAVIMLRSVASTCCRCSLKEPLTTRSCVFVNHQLRQYSAEPEPLPAPGGDKQYPEHIVSIVDQISKMTLLEVSSLNELLKAKLNIQDAPMMPMGGMAAPAAAVEEEEEAVVEEVQTEFTVKLVAFDDKAKVKLIKEIKSVMADFNLVQAKKFVEGVPQLVKEDIPKEEADQLKAQLEAVGATVEIS